MARHYSSEHFIGILGGLEDFTDSSIRKKKSLLFGHCEGESSDSVGDITLQYTVLIPDLGLRRGVRWASAACSSLNKA